MNFFNGDVISSKIKIADRNESNKLYLKGRDYAKKNEAKNLKEEKKMVSYLIKI